MRAASVGLGATTLNVHAHFLTGLRGCLSNHSAGLHFDMVVKSFPGFHCTRTKEDREVDAFWGTVFKRGGILGLVNKRAYDIEAFPDK